MDVATLVVLVHNTLVKSNGALNSLALLSPKHKNLVDLVVSFTQYLEEDSPFSRRWWHLLNGPKIPKCLNCGKLVKWGKSCRYSHYCTKVCAWTSEECAKRTSLLFKGKKHSLEHSKKHSESSKGRLVSDATRDKIRLSKLGNKNPRFGKKPWNKGLFGADNPLTGKKRSPYFWFRGKLNSQFGKSPSKRAGRGVWGNFNGLHFRSSLELFYLLFWFEKGVIVESAEKDEFRVEYLTKDSRVRTYSPDFVIRSNNLIIELKPEKMHLDQDVLAKFEALKSKCIEYTCKLCGFKDIGVFILEALKNKVVEKYMENKTLVLTEGQYLKLKRNYSDIIRSCL